jgi:hypothetical protein
MLKRVLSGPAGPYIAAFGCYIPSVLLAFLVPGDVLSAHPAANEFSQIMSSWIPMIERASGLSPLPQVVRFYFAVMWALMPLWIGVLFAVPEERMSPIGRMRQGKYFLALFVPTFVPAVVHFWIIFPLPPLLSDAPRLASAMLSSRSGLALLGIIGPGGIAIAIFGTVMWVRRIPALYFKSRQENGSG